MPDQPRPARPFKDMFPTGKLPIDVLRAVLARVPRRDPRVLVGPQVGEDSAVIDLGDRCLVAATDPVTFAVDHIGWYAVHVNANDVAVMGARPAWFLATLLLPPDAATRALVDSIMGDIATACDELHVTLCGGHTEITEGVSRPIVVGQMLGEVASDRLLRKDRVEVGDRVLLTRGIAVEGTAVLARERGDRLARHVDAGVLARAAGFLTRPGISVVAAALAVIERGGDAVHAMHDPTEGGLAGGLVELVAPAALGLRVDRRQIHVFPETLAICHALGLDPLKLLASGALLAAVAPDRAGAVVEHLRDVGIDAWTVGEVRPSVEGLTIGDEDGVEPLTSPARDEIVRALSSPSPD